MNAERLKQIEDIYHAALQTPPGKRETFFKEYCGADQSLRFEVESLLAFDKSFDKFIDSPPESIAAEMFSEQENPSNLINREIGRYKIRKLLGEGGMGKVFLAEDIELERLVALKILPADFAGDKARVHRFIREAKAISALNHPNILTIYEIGNFENLRFIATEYIEGETLRQRQIREPLDLREILDAAAQIAAALNAAHSAGIIHRDIKPENIMLREDGFTKVLDFGLAKLTEKQSPTEDLEAPTRQLDVTNPGTIMGTASYMSPEQIRGRNDIDGRTDIWSLGVVIFEILTGRVPFPGETVSDVIASILKSDAPHLSKCVENCPAELERIVTKCLQKNREERYQVVKDLALDLKTLRRELEYSTEFAPVTDSAKRNLTVEIQQQTTNIETGRRFSALNVLSILLAAGLIFGGIWWFFGTARNFETPEAASLKTVEVANWSSSPGEVYSVGSFSPDGKMTAFSSTRSGSKNIWIKQTTSGEAVQITKDEFGSEQPIWSPSGEELAFFSTRGNQAGIWRMPILGGSPKLIAPLEDGSSILRLWSKQNLIYYESNYDIYAVDVNSGQTKRLTNFDANGIEAESMNISPDEQRVIYVTVDGETWNIWTKNLDENAPKKLYSTNSEIRNTIFHADGQRFFFSQSVDDEFQIFVTDINAAPPKQITFAERDCFVVNASSDGARILYGSAKEESDIWSVNVKDAKEITVASDIDSELWANVSPDGKTIAYQSIRNLSQGNKISKGAILTKNLNSDESPAELVGGGFSPVWSPDGQTIAYAHIAADDKFQISTIRAGNGGQKFLAADDSFPASYTTLPYNRLQNAYFSWSPNSAKIAYISKRNGQYNIWLANPDGSGNTQLTDNNDQNIYCPLWSADGKQIAFTSRTGSGIKKPFFSLSMIDAETKNVRIMTQRKTFFRLISWMPNNREIILAATDESETNGSPLKVSLLCLKVETGEIRTIAELSNVYQFNINLAPDGRNIAFAAHRDGKDNIWLIPATGGAAERKLTNNNDSRLYFSSLAWSPDSNSIFFGKQSRYSLLSMISNFK